jgi:hypothetical protein
LWLFVKMAIGPQRAIELMGSLRHDFAGPPLQKTKKPKSVGLGFESTKGGGGGDTGRSTGPVLAGGATSDLGTLPTFAFALWRALMRRRSMD